eukprot:TRINITY_DN1319_c1_g2_i1.p2 TRINITY_DN1319_c1_g2~~TRINITY_DN1319_c1_g2_i1.p2  ORF type:complete len:106 (-),score=13.29 TRINITY_DN1319_c1_g2_i1:176-493(-)
MDKPLKIIHVGEAGVGKSSLLLRYTDDTFAEHPISTIGVDYKSCSLTRGGNTFELQIVRRHTWLWWVECFFPPHSTWPQLEERRIIRAIRSVVNFRTPEGYHVQK